MNNEEMRKEYKKHMMGADYVMEGGVKVAIEESGYYDAFRAGKEARQPEIDRLEKALAESSCQVERLSREVGELKGILSSFADRAFGFDGNMVITTDRKELIEIEAQLNKE